MESKQEKINFAISFLYFIFGCLGLAIIIMHLVTWSANPNYYIPSLRDPYSLHEDGSRWNHLTYFTNLVLIIFCLWAIIKFLATIFKLKKVANALDNKYFLLFMALNNVVVILTYTFLIIAMKNQINFHDPDPYNRHNIATSLFKHYFLASLAIIYIFYKKPKNLEFKKSLLLLTFPLSYFIIIKIVGLFAFKYEWYPYPFFDTKFLWANLVGSMETYNKNKAWLYLLLILSLILVIYIVLIYLFSKLFSKKDDR